MTYTHHPHWRVSVETSGDLIVAIEPEMLAGRELSEADEDAIRTAAHHLLAFIGDIAALSVQPAAAVVGEPVAWIAQSRWEQMTAAEPWLTNVVYSEDQSASFPCVPLYAVPSAPDGLNPEKMAEVLRGYEAWEADIIMNGDWDRETPHLTQEQFDEMLRLQDMRNAALRSETP